MKFPWVIRLDLQDAAALGALRLTRGIEVAEADQEVWLRGPKGDDQLTAGVSGLPATARYERLPQDRLRRIDERIPGRTLPALRWQPLDAWLRVELPVAALPANSPAPVAVRLVRSSFEREAELLLTRLEAWRQFALQAAQVRLEPLGFAAAPEGWALVRGKPLPPLPGRRFLLHAGVAVPSGFTWHPSVSAEVLARRLGAAGDALVVWQEDGTLLRLHAEQFVPATRSGIRATGKPANDSP